MNRSCNNINDPYRHHNGDTLSDESWLMVASAGDIPGAPGQPTYGFPPPTTEAPHQESALAPTEDYETVDPRQFAPDHQLATTSKEKHSAAVPGMDLEVQASLMGLPGMRFAALIPESMPLVTGGARPIAYDPHYLGPSSSSYMEDALNAVPHEMTSPIDDGSTTNETSCQTPRTMSPAEDLRFQVYESTDPEGELGEGPQIQIAGNLTEEDRLRPVVWNILGEDLEPGTLNKSQKERTEKCVSNALFQVKPMSSIIDPFYFDMCIVPLPFASNIPPIFTLGLEAPLFSAKALMIEYLGFELLHALLSLCNAEGKHVLYMGSSKHHFIVHVFTWGTEIPDNVDYLRCVARDIVEDWVTVWGCSSAVTSITAHLKKMKMSTRESGYVIAKQPCEPVTSPRRDHSSGQGSFGQAKPKKPTGYETC